uniref:Cryptochrome DASH n=1 Tax=Karenia brevis TaxID=156230 RepID=Q1G0Y2_KARBR|nr:cryptochrome dash [Karenia brevis]
MVAPAAGTARAFWFRTDLRLDDQPALSTACEDALSLLPIYVFDPAKFIDLTLAGARKSSARRARFLIESLVNLRRRLEDRGSGLAVAIGDPAVVIADLCASASAIYVTQGICSEETQDEARVESKMKAPALLSRVWGGSLYFPDECGCNPTKAPLLFSNFKKKAEVFGKIREPLAELTKLPSLPGAVCEPDLSQALRFMPTLAELGFESEEINAAEFDDPRGVLPFSGGEDAALTRLQKWIWDDDHLREYWMIRNGMKGEGYSSKFSPWLALGCLSPRRVWKEVQRYEKERVKNKSTYWLVFELMWRDFFVYMALTHGDKLFRKGGITGDRKRSWPGSTTDLDRWKNGKTGDLLVDANMLELLATGWMSNRGRQNVASYLIFNMRVDWRYGAAHFEEHLLDYDPCSNWGNWVAAAGLTGQRVNKFNTLYQLDRYDPSREYVKHWLGNLDDQHSKLDAEVPECSANVSSDSEYIKEAGKNNLQDTSEGASRTKRARGKKSKKKLQSDSVAMGA